MFFRLCMCSDSRRGFPDNLRQHMCVLKASRLSPAGFVVWAAKQGAGLNSAYQIDLLPAVLLYAELPYSCSCLVLFLDQGSVLFGILETFKCIFSYLVFWWCFSHMHASYSLEDTTGFFPWLLLHWKRKAKSSLSGLFVWFLWEIFFFFFFAKKAFTGWRQTSCFQLSFLRVYSTSDNLCVRPKRFSFIPNTVLCSLSGPLVLAGER